MGGFEIEHSAASLVENYNLAVEKGDLKEAAASANALGHLLKRECKWSEATKWFKTDYELSCQLSKEHDLPAALNSLGDIYLIQRKYAKAEKWMNKHLKLATEDLQLPLEEQRASTQLTRLYAEIYEASADCKNLIKAKKYSLRALELADRLSRFTKSYEELASACLNAGFLALCSDDYIRAEQHLLRALEIYDNEELHEPTLNSQIHFNLSQLYRVTLKEAKAFKHINKDINICKQDKLTLDLAKAYLEKGSLHLFSLEKDFKTNLEAAEEAYKRAREAAEQIKNDDLRTKCDENLVTVKQAWKDWETFISLLARQNAFRRRSRSSGPQERIELLMNCARILLHLGDLAYTLEAWKKMVEVSTLLREVAEELKRVNLVIYSRLDLGLALMKLREFGRAREVYGEALVNCKAKSDLEGQCVANIGLGSTNDHEGNYAEALRHYWAALNTARQRGPDELCQLQLEAAENIHYVYLVRLADEEKVREAQQLLEGIRKHKKAKGMNVKQPPDDTSGKQFGSEFLNPVDRSLRFAVEKPTFNAAALGNGGDAELVGRDVLEEMLNTREVGRTIYRAGMIGIGQGRNTSQPGTRIEQMDTEASSSSEEFTVEETSDSETEQETERTKEGYVFGARPIRKESFSPGQGHVSGNQRVRLGQEGRSAVKADNRSPRELLDESESPEIVPAKRTNHVESRKRKILLESEEEEGEGKGEGQQNPKGTTIDDVSGKRRSKPVGEGSLTSSPTPGFERETRGDIPLSAMGISGNPRNSNGAQQTGLTERQFSPIVPKNLSETHEELRFQGHVTTSQDCLPSTSAAPPSKSTGREGWEGNFKTVIVEIEAQLFRVPLKDATAAARTVGWLADQCARVFFEHDSQGGRWPGLKLSYQGVNLDSEQSLEELFTMMNTQHVLKAKVTKWTLEHNLPLRDLYVVSCHDINRKVHQGILNHAKNAGDMAVVGHALEEQDVQPLLRAIRRSSVTPTSLNLSHNALGDSTILCISEVIEDMKQETLSLNLDLHCNNLSISSLGLLATSTVTMMRLEVLDLSGNLLGDGGSRALSHLLSKATELRHLALQRCGIGERTISDIARILPISSPLMKLKLGYNQVVPDTVWESLTEKLLHLKGFKELDIAGMKVGNVGVRAIAKLLESSQSFSALHMGWNTLVEDDVTELAKGISSSAGHLSLVDLSACDIHVTYSDALLTKLLQLSKLTVLVLSENPIEAKGSKEIAAALRKGGCSLQRLILANCGLEHRGILDILESLSGNTVLEVLNLAANLSSSSLVTYATTPKPNVDTQKKSVVEQSPSNTWGSGQQTKKKKSLIDIFLGSGVGFGESLEEEESTRPQEGAVAESAETEIAEDSEEQERMQGEVGRSQGEEEEEREKDKTVGGRTTHSFPGTLSNAQPLFKTNPSTLSSSGHVKGTIDSLWNTRSTMQQQQEKQREKQEEKVVESLQKEERKGEGREGSYDKARQGNSVEALSTEGLSLPREVRPSGEEGQRGQVILENREPESRLSGGFHCHNMEAGGAEQRGIESGRGVQCLLQWPVGELVMGGSMRRAALEGECLLGDACSLLSMRRLSAGRGGGRGSSRQFGEGLKREREVSGNEREEERETFLERVMAAVSAAKGLTILDLSWNGFSQEDVRRLQEAVGE